MILFITLSLSYSQRAINPFELLNIPSMKLSDLFSNDSINSSISQDKKVSNNGKLSINTDSNSDIQFFELNSSEVKKVKNKNLKNEVVVNSERVIPHEKYESFIGYPNVNGNNNQNNIPIFNSNSNNNVMQDFKSNGINSKQSGLKNENTSLDGNKDIMKILDQIQRKISNIEERLNNK